MLEDSFIRCHAIHVPKADQIKENVEQHPELMQPYQTLAQIKEITFDLTAQKVQTQSTSESPNQDVTA